MITAQQLAEIYDIRLERANPWVEPLDAVMDRFEITTTARAAAFIAQIGHESGRLKYVRELWGPTPTQLRYEGRADLGNTEPGDGFRYRGRGLIQVTGRANYRKASLALGEDFERRPDLLELPAYAAMTAGWFWQSHGCNELADAGEFERITRRINGGLNGHEERVELWMRALAVLA